MVVARNESFEVKNLEAVNPGICRMYVTHLGLIGVGVKVSSGALIGGPGLPGLGIGSCRGPS